MADGDDASTLISDESAAWRELPWLHNGSCRGVLCSHGSPGTGMCCLLALCMHVAAARLSQAERSKWVPGRRGRVVTCRETLLLVQGLLCYTEKGRDRGCCGGGGDRSVPHGPCCKSSCGWPPLLHLHGVCRPGAQRWWRMQNGYIDAFRSGCVALVKGLRRCSVGPSTCRAGVRDYLLCMGARRIMCVMEGLAEG